MSYAMTRFWCHYCRHSFLLDPMLTGHICPHCGSDLVEEIRSEDDPRRFRPVLPIIPLVFAVFTPLDISDFRLFSTLFPSRRNPQVPATPSQLQSLQAAVWPETQGQECAICQCEFREPEACKRMTCRHVYHWECLRGWLSRSASCPVCRRGL